jgi:hypothetical protein
MGFDDLTKKGTDALNSEKGEQMSDSALDKGGDAASKATGGKYDEHLEKGETQADKRIGQE